MDNKRYTSAKNAQIIISLLKQYGVSKVIASPGTQNMSLVTSMQRDIFFEIYSAPDERSAAYMACGLAAESGQPVVLSCTGATASRNYIPGLTEAFYRHLPVIAITSTERVNKVGHNIPQIIDRSVIPCDIAKISVRAIAVTSEDEEWECVIQVNKALAEIHHHGCGPVHINLEKENDRDFSSQAIPCYRRIFRHTAEETNLPSLPAGRIALFMGAHTTFSSSDAKALDEFCACHDAVVFCDHCSGYYGEYAAHLSLVASQERYDSHVLSVDLLICMGEISGDYYLQGKLGRMVKDVWRVNEDGLIKDPFKKVTHVFEMCESTFLSHYTRANYTKRNDQLLACYSEYDKVYKLIPELPFSNIWMAKTMAPKIPKNSVMCYGILNSLRAWNFFRLPENVSASSNVGGFGIDGGLSTLIGESLANPNKLYFGVFGDLAFFYDFNSLGNRHIGCNLRILLVNNSKGSEFRLYSHPASQLGNDADTFIAAAGHYGNGSPTLVKHYVEDLGFDYISARTKEEFILAIDIFTHPNQRQHPLLLETFTRSENESSALQRLNYILVSPENKRKEMVKKVFGDKTVHTAKRIVNNLLK